MFENRDLNVNEGVKYISNAQHLITAVKKNQHEMSVKGRVQLLLRNLLL